MGVFCRRSWASLCHHSPEVLRKLTREKIKGNDSENRRNEAPKREKIGHGGSMICRFDGVTSGDASGLFRP